MRIRRRTLAGLALLTTAGLALAGCDVAGTTGSGAAPATSPAETPKETLVKSTIQLSKGNYTYATTGGAQSYEGEVHLPESALLTVVDSSDDGGEFSYLVVGEERWVRVKVDLPADMPSLEEIEELAGQSPELAKMAKQVKTLTQMVGGKKWLTIDPDRIDEFGTGFNGFEHPDATGASFMLANATTAERTGDTITGELDLSKVKEESLPWASDEVADLAKAGPVPYVATLDAQGRLAELVLDLPKMGDQKAHRETLTITGYGAATVQAKPRAGDTITMTDDMYDLLNGR